MLSLLLTAVALAHFNLTRTHEMYTSRSTHEKWNVTWH